ncbi:class I SAM-dependent methyltransferase [Egibacter rhizosphaerae]|uniref:class I SAM-dependent methyltransferase n=1 Tax=Egibacter rhizosphaerae TaxID=1670831 RepID=UPI0013F149A2|nr:class I SAM-dependent methyltransferase [Egibacter rhizosphaerae]
MDARTRHSIDAYDAAARAYHDHWWDRRPLDAVRRFARSAGRGAIVLDVASGPALDVRGLRDVGLSVVAGDRSMEAMRLGLHLFPKRPLAVWDLRALPFADDTFGGIWAHAALQHLPRGELRRAFGELRRVHARGPIFVTFREGDGDLERVDDPPVGEVYATTLREAELKALLIDQGYRDVEVERRPDPLERREVAWLHGWGLFGAPGT